MAHSLSPFEREIVFAFAERALTDNASHEMPLLQPHFERFAAGKEIELRCKDDSIIGFGPTGAEHLLTPAVLFIAAAAYAAAKKEAMDLIRSSSESALRPLFKSLFKARETGTATQGPEFSAAQLARIRMQVIDAAKRQGISDEAGSLIANSITASLLPAETTSKV